MVELLPLLLNDVKEFTPETWKSFETNFPEQTAAWRESEPRVKKFYEFIKSLPKNQNIVEDPETFKKFVEIGLQKLLPAEAVKA
ncbi:unnamed protein product [Strongylus vulgaris]|uniref:Uncharacterized protein n=1 Tax=Strongylus vulgaris TaxID=40348 RepID=A0A3P7J2G1_STRVU|nr:unnamed protein product [Strongylus vulgaris]